MKKRKILISLALASACLFSLASCGGEDTPTETTPTTTVTPTTTPTTTPSATTTTTTPADDGLVTVKYSVGFNDYITGNSIGQANVPLRIQNVSLNNKDIQMTGDQTTTVDGVTYKQIKAVKGSAGAPAITISVGGPGKVTMYCRAQGSNRQLHVIDSQGQPMSVKKNGETIASGVIDTDTSVFKLEVEVEDEEIIGLWASNGWCFYYIETEFETELGDQTGIKVTGKGTVDYLEGTDYTSSKVEVSATYSSGANIVLQSDEYTIDSSAFVKGTPGQYNIKFTSGEFETELPVTVYEAKTFEKSLQYMAKDANNKWGNNSALRSVDAKQVYLANGDLDTSAVTVSVKGEVEVSGKKLEKTFILDTTAYTITSDMVDASGTYTATVSSTINGKAFTSTYPVYLVKTSPSIESDTVTVTVDQKYTGEIGADVAGQGNMFTSIQQALQFLASSSLVTEDMKKVINVKPGIYNEKVDVALKNVSLVGEDAESTIITYNAANGLTDARGTSYSTDGSATFSVRFEAENFYASDITFDNWCNSLERYNELKEITGNTQSLAVMVQADRAVFDNCRLTGYHDTLEMQGSGRVYFYKCYIQGATDFIFGTNTSALFDDCDIFVLSNGQSANGGFICAPKGNNKGDDATKYGYIFNNCRFDTDSTPDGTTAICRPWAAYATVTVMNSELGNFISKEGYANGDTQGHRYVGGLASGVTPVTTTVKFREYGNTGDGAITAAVNGMQMLTAADATALLNSFWDAYSVPYTADEKYSFTFTAWTKPALKDRVATPVIAATGTTVSWTAVANATSYDIYINDVFASNQTETEYTVTLGTQDTKKIRVVAKADSTHKDSKYSNQVVVSNVTSKLGTPVVTVDTNNINTIKWDAVEDAGSYEVYKGTTLVATVTTTSYTFAAEDPEDIQAKVVAKPAAGDQAHEDSDASTEVQVSLVVPYLITTDTTIKFCNDANGGNYKQLVDVSGFTESEIKTDTVGFSGTFSFKVPARTLVTINGYPAYVNYTVNGELSDTVRVIYATTQTTITVTAGAGNNYIKTIDILTNQDAPVAATVKSLTITGGNREFNTGTAFSSDGLKVVATYSDGLIKQISEKVGDEDGYVISHSIDINVANTYTVSVTYGDKTSTYDVVYTAPTTSIISAKTILFGSSGNYADSSSKLTYNASDLADNNNDTVSTQVKGDVSFTVNAGAMVTIYGYKGYTSYNLKSGETVLSGTNPVTEQVYQYYVSADDTTLTIHPTTTDNYLYAIYVAYAYETSTKLVFEANSTGITETAATYQNVVTQLDNVFINTLTGKLNVRASNGSQFNSGTTVSFAVKAGAVVKVKCYIGINSVETKTYSIYMGDNVQDCTAQETTFVATEDGIVTIECLSDSSDGTNSGKQYIYYADITYGSQA